MRHYEYIPQEKSDYCIPACLQIILKSRNLPCDSQKQIMEECGRNIGIEGTIGSYFEKKGIPLSCVDFKIRKSFFREFEHFVKSVLSSDGDLLVMYAYEALHEQKEEVNHASLLVECDGKNAVLLDPDNTSKGIIRIPYEKLINALYKGEDGFHCIHPDANVLETLEMD